MTWIAGQRWYSPPVPKDCVGFCYRCGRGVKLGSGWVLLPVNAGINGKSSIQSRLFHGGACPSPDRG